MLKTISITVIGKVQGVFFRQSAKEKALAAGVSGYVSNQPDGTVLIIATGTSEQLGELITWCKTGPPRAEVISVDTRELPLEVFSRFTIERF
jgi:acylphosphatase